MRPTEQQGHPKQLHLAHQAQPALELAPRHPPTLLLAASRHPPPRRNLHDGHHLRRCRRWLPPSAFRRWATTRLMLYRLQLKTGAEQVPPLEYPAAAFNGGSAVAG